MAKEKISGIYKITAKHNGKIYIGQSIDIYERWRGHWKQVNQGDSNYIHNAMRKYGKDGFIFEIIERCSQDIINEREKYWIDYYDSYNNGYNLTIGGEGIKGKIFTDEERENKRNFSVNNNLNKPIIQFDLDGNIVAEWVGSKEINKKLGYSFGSISACAKMKDKYRTAYGYIWLYKDYYEKNGIDLQYHLEKLVNDSIYQIDKSGKIVKIWDNMGSLPKKYKPSTLYQCLDETNKNHKTAYGYVWVFKRNYNKDDDYSKYFIRNFDRNKIYQFSKNGIFITVHENLDIASLVSGVSYGNIGHCVRHEQKTAGGYIWLLEKDVEDIDKYVDALKPKEKKTYQKNLSLPQYKRINLVDNKHNIIKTYNTASEAAKELKLSSGRIHEVCRKKYVHTKGYIFEYAS